MHNRVNNFLPLQMRTPTKCRTERQQLFQERQKRTKLAYDEYIASLKAETPLTPTFLAKKHDCCHGTLKSWIDGGMSKHQSSAQRLKLMPEEEAIMVQYLIETAKRGFPDTPKRAAMHSNCILREHTGDPTASVGHNWINRFLNRHKSQLSRYWSTTLTTVSQDSLNILAKHFRHSLIRFLCLPFSV